MTKMTGKSTLVSRFLRDRAGNFAMVTAVVIPVILAAGGIAIDLTKTVLAKAELQDASDAAVLAAASALANDGKTPEQAKRIAAELFAMQMTGSSSIVKEGDKTIIDSAPVINITETPTANNGKAFKVDIAATHIVKYTVFTRLLGHTTGTLNSASTAESKTATESKNAFSMFLVLDRSGSMSFATSEKDPDPTKKCQRHLASNWYTANLAATAPCYISKIAALKSAVAALTKQLNTADPGNKYVRTGASSYNDIMLKSVSALAWGTTGISSYVNAIPAVPLGGTDSSDAFAEAVKQLKSANEITLHQKQNGMTPSRYIVFMTDGENTHYRTDPNTTEANRQTLASCAEAKTAGIQVYSVAFLAPENGQKLLKTCASSPDHYFAAEDVATLISAFKVIGAQTAAVVSRLTK